MKAPIRIGIVGLGRLGQRHAENLAAHVLGAKLVAACSPVESERAWAHERFKGEVFESYESMLERADIDAVWLVTPTSLHADQIIAGMAAGKHVFCEKPLSLDVSECDRVIAEREKCPHLKVMIGFVRRFDASYERAYKKVQANEIGRPFMVRSQTCDRNDPDGFFVRFSGTSGGLFLDCSVHDIDLARWMLGNPRATRVYGCGTIAVHQGLREFSDIDNGVAICEFEGGRLAIFYASRTTAHGHDAHTQVIGTNGSLVIGQNPRLDRVEILDEHGARNECTPTFFERFEDAFLHEARAFVASIDNGVDTGLTLEDAREATRIAAAMRESLHRRQPVDL